ncbi:MAG: lipopolysaccharide biosynthesis protein [Muribaculaceae bacterium]|nr:lipopolysaccharide biosynthesis protein [Muribaculaceae bacterium]
MLYLRMFLVMGVSLYTSRIVLRQLGSVDYGIYNVVGGIIVMLSFLNGAMSMSTVRFLSYSIGRHDADEGARVFRTAITIHILLSLIILILAETLGLWFLNHYMTIPSGQLQAANWVYQCTVVSFVFSILRTPLSAVVVSRERMEIFAVLSVLEVMMKLVVAISLTFILGNKLKAYALLNLGAVALLTLITLIYCRKRFPECSSIRTIYDKELFLPMAGFMSWSTIGTLAWVGKNQGCNILLNLFFGPAVNAAYALSAQVNTALKGFVQNFSTAINPQIFKTYSAGEVAQTEMLIISGCKISFYLLLILSFPILIATEPILKIWLGSYPHYTPIFIQLVIVISLIESFTYSIGAGVRATGRVKIYEITVGGVQLLNLPIAYILLRNGLPPQSVFFTIAMIALVALFIRLGILKNSIRQISMRRIIQSVFLPSGLLAIVCALLYSCHRQLEFTQNINPIITILGSMLIVVILEAGIGLNSKERKIIRQTLAKRIV